MNEEKHFGRRQDDLVLIQLTEKIVENNNSVSTVVNLMSENLSELVETIERIEDKIDSNESLSDVLTIVLNDIGVIKSKVDEFKNETKQQNDVINDIKLKVETSSKILNQINELGILPLANFIKRVLYAIVFAASAGIIFLVIKQIITFYAKHGAPLIGG